MKKECKLEPLGSKRGAVVQGPSKNGWHDGVADPASPSRASPRIHCSRGLPPASLASMALITALRTAGLVHVEIAPSR